MPRIQDLKSQRRGLMIILSSPSGAGKSTLTRHILQRDTDITKSVSATTRPARRGEVEGEDYFFLDKSEFTKAESSGGFLEHARVFDNYYGTPRQPVEQALQAGRDVIFDIDWQGAQQLTEAAADDLVKIFILPPNMHALEQRLHSRAQDSAEIIAARMAKSEAEMSHWLEYDYVIVNEDLETALEEILTIIRCERMRRRRQIWVSDFVRGLISGGQG